MMHASRTESPLSDLEPPAFAQQEIRRRHPHIQPTTWVAVALAFTVLEAWHDPRHD